MRRRPRMLLIIAVFVLAGAIVNVACKPSNRSAPSTTTITAPSPMTANDPVGDIVSPQTTTPASRPVDEFVVIDDTVDPSPEVPNLALPAKEDLDDRRPRDVVVRFLQLVDANDLASARQLWVLGKQGVVNSEADWLELCSKLRENDQIRVGTTGYGKGCRVVWYAKYRNGKRVGMGSFWVFLEEGRWRIAS